MLVFFPLVGQGFLIVEASRSHSDTLHSIGLLWTSDQLDAETSTFLLTTLTPPAFFESAITASELQQSHALDRATTGIGTVLVTVVTF
jgi:hypothetical protein